MTEKESSAILEEAMALFREKYEKEMVRNREDSAEDELEDDEELVM